MLFKKLQNSIRKRIALRNPIKREVVRGITWDLDCRETIDLNIHYGGWEPNSIAVFEQYVKKGDVVVEVGANVGAHTLLIADLVGPDGFVHAIEPTTYARLKLYRNLALNPNLCARTKVHDFLITDKNDDNPRRSIQSSWKTSRRFYQNPNETVSSDAITIDEFSRMVELHRCDLLKIDIDGYDLKAIVGAAEFVYRFRPKIFIELCDSELKKNGGRLSELISVIKSHGYTGFDTSSKESIDESYIEKLPSGASRNGFFVPNA